MVTDTWPSTFLWCMKYVPYPVHGKPLSSYIFANFETTEGQRNAPIIKETLPYV